jgi:hypothetical protein
LAMRGAGNYTDAVRFSQKSPPANFRRAFSDLPA